MYTLTIWWGYCSGAALFYRGENGKSQIVGASSEERFSGVKNTSVFPEKTIEWLRTFTPKNKFDSVTYTSNDVGIDYLLCDKGVWSVKKYVKENIEFWYPKLLNNKNLDYLQYLKKDINLDTWPGKSYWKSIGIGSAKKINDVNKNFNNSIDLLLSKRFDLDLNCIHRVDHHTSHIHYCISTNPILSKKTLVFTVDGWGDGRNATVSIVTKSENTIHVEEIFSSKNCTLARTYRFITLLLGMKPSEHEFKVMGLAAYGKDKYFDSALNVFKDSMSFSSEEVDFIINKNYKDSYFTFQQLLIAERFDNIAAGLQRWLEITLIDWVKFFVDKTNINNIGFSGGVAMNCKAMHEISKQKFIRSIHVPPSSGDESHIFGSYYGYIYKKFKKRCEISGIPYFGYKSHSNDIQFLPENNKFITKDIDFNFIVRKIKRGSIIAICRGSAEFGARSLGNRSLLIDPCNFEAKEKLNIAVKNRDFWMPFAPIILDKYAKLYLKNINKNKSNRFMSVIYETTKLGKSKMLFATHQADSTCRAQILTINDNKFLYSLMEKYSKICNNGSLLNTSFNTHGNPIVNTSKQALRVFLETPIDLLILDDKMLVKTNKMND